MRRLREGLETARAAAAAETMRDRPLSIVAGGLTAAAGAVAVGLLGVGLFVLLAWALDAPPGGSVGEVGTASLAGWLLSHGIPVTVADLTLGVPPLGVTLLLALVLARGGGLAARTAEVATVGQAVRVASAVAAGYGVIALFLLWPAAAFGVTADPVVTFVAAYVLAFLASALGALRACPPGAVRDALPESVRRALPGAGIMLGSLLGAGALLLALSLGLHASRFGKLIGDLDPGVAGTIALFLLCLAYLPTAVVWGASYVSGVGFGVGSGGVVSPWEVSGDPLPVPPLVAAIPTEGPNVLLWLVVLVPLVGGILAGGRIRRDVVASGTSAVIRAAALSVLIAAAVAAVVMGGLALLASGPLGSENLATVGPPAHWVALVVLCQGVVAGLLGALVTTPEGSA